MTAKGIAFLTGVAVVWPPLIILGSKHLLRKPKDSSEQRQLSFAKIQVVMWILLTAFVMPAVLGLPGQPYWLSGSYWLLITAPGYIWGSIWIGRLLDSVGGLGQ